MFFNNDGTIQEVVYSLGLPNTTEDGVIEAESFNTQVGGIQIQDEHIGFIKHDNSVQYNGLDLIQTNYEFKMRYSSNLTASSVSLETPEGVVLGTINLPLTGSWNNWEDVTEIISLSQGIEDLVIKFHHPENDEETYLANVDWFKLTDLNLLSTSNLKVTDTFSIYPNSATNIINIYNNII